MKKLALFCTLVLCMSGCTSQAIFVKSIDANWATIGPEYTAYIDADPTLDAVTKKIRKRTAEMMTKAIEEAKATTQQ